MNSNGPPASHGTPPQRQQLCVMRAVSQVRFRRARRFPRRPLRGKRRSLLEAIRRCALALRAAAPGLAPACTPGPGTARVLVFGASFAAGSRVPQESAWPAVVEAADPGLEVVNFGVDGYSLAQSLLRYRGVGASLAHDVVILTLSPRADLWREVNTLRALAGWRSYRVMPRFVLDDGLKLVPSPYDPPSAVHADNPSGLRPRLREHLRRYDRFYVPWMYDPPRGLA